MGLGILDPFVRAWVYVTSDHHYIHMGKGFSYNADTASLAAGASERWSFKTPANGPIIHFRPSRISSTANSASIEVFERAVVSGGTLQAPRNRLRLFPKKSRVELRTGSSPVTAGLSLFKDSVGTGGTSSRAGGASDGSSDEWVFDRDTWYDIEIKNTGTVTATVVTLGLFWYEE